MNWQTDLLSSMLLLLPPLSSCGEQELDAVAGVAGWTPRRCSDQGRGDPVYQLYRVRSIAELPDDGSRSPAEGGGEIRLCRRARRFLRALGGMAPGRASLAAC
jgi:hypothetical protein